MSTTGTLTTVSAPGKVLLVGGYLILEEPNEGLVIAADKRFYCTIEKTPQTVPPVDGAAAEDIAIRVHSPQFHESWGYTFSRHDHSVRLASDSEGGPSNSFVEKTLRVTLAYLAVRQPAFHQSVLSLDITIRADNDFYSVLPHLKARNWEATFKNVVALPKCLPCPRDEHGQTVVHKTGLGSSAALVTSLVGALLQTLRLESESHLWEEQTHRLAQICHCHAQGKVGSGFDVSAAVHGSHVYRRFPKRLLGDLLNELDGSDNKHQSHGMLSLEMAAAIQHLVDHMDWSGGLVTPLALPKGLQLMLADVGGGSESPSMARRVLQWKKDERDNAGETPLYWRRLSELNSELVGVLRRAPPLDIAEVTALASLSLEKDKLQTPNDLLELRRLFIEVRSNLRSIGEAVGVPVEPGAQTILADATMNLPGVIAALVPGAGGYDAMACLCVDSVAVREAVGTLWAGWKDAPVCPLAVQAASYGEGIAVEQNFQLHAHEADES